MGHQGGQNCGESVAKSALCPATASYHSRATVLQAKTRVDCHIISLAFSPDGRVLAIAGTSSLKFWFATCQVGHEDI